MKNWLQNFNSALNDRYHLVEKLILNYKSYRNDKALHSFEWVIYSYFQNVSTTHILYENIKCGKTTFKINVSLLSRVTFQLKNYFHSIQNSEEPKNIYLFPIFKNSMTSVTSQVTTMTTQTVPRELLIVMFFVLIIFVFYLFYRKKRE